VFGSTPGALLVRRSNSGGLTRLGIINYLVIIYQRIVSALQYAAYFRILIAAGKYLGSVKVWPIADTPRLLSVANTLVRS
jgi:hypothetical protein